jgi:cytochrome P450
MRMSKLGVISWGPLVAIASASWSAACGPPRPPVVPVGPTRALADTTYYVSVNDSPDLKKKIDDDCAQKHADDPNAKAGCVQTMAKVSAGEGMRFVKGANSKWMWVNFGTDAAGKELVYHQITFSIVPENNPSKLTVKPEGTDTGSKAAGTLPTDIVFDLPDDFTVLLFDPNGGTKVVYKRKPLDQLKRAPAGGRLAAGRPAPIPAAMPSLHDLPRAPGANLLGHAHLLGGSRLNFFRDVGRQGGLVRARFLFRDVLFANDPASAHEVLVEKARSFEKSPGLRLLLHYLAGRGLFTAEGELWRRQRRLMAPLFAPSAVSHYARQMHEVTLRALARYRDGDAVDLARETTRIAMGVVGRALFDSDTFDGADEIGDVITTGLGWVNDNAGSAALIVHIVALNALDALPARLDAVRGPLRARFEEPFLLKGAHSPGLRAAIARIDHLVQRMIDERRRAPGKGDDLLGRLLSARDAEDASFAGMSDRQLRDEAVTLFVAGHETTATALSWTFYLLAKHPAWRDRVQAEVDALPPGPVSFESAAQLGTTLRVFKEAMRLYPPVDLLARRTLEPVTLGGASAPARTIVFVSPWVVHRHAPTWPDPERFDPDRFLPEAEAARPRSAWLPFGAGPRICIGNHFAMLEGPIVLATLMRAATFEIDASRDIEPEAFATLRPKGGMPAVVRLRN